MESEAVDPDYIGWKEVAWSLIEQRCGLDRRAFERTGPDRRKRDELRKKDVDTKTENE